MASSTLGRWPLHGGTRLRGLIPRPLGGDADALARVVGDYFFGLDDAPAPSELATSRIPDGSFRWTLSWRTDVMVARDGTEQRRATLTNPRHRFDGSFLLDDADTRTIRQLLSATPDATYDLPLAHEAVAAIVDLSGGTIFISSTAAALADWITSGRRIYVRGPSGSAYTTTITGASGGTINVASSPPVAGYFPAHHTLIFPCETVRFEDGQALDRYAVTMSRWGFSSRAAARATGGAGAPALTTHDGMTVLDRRPFQEKTVAEAFAAGVEFLDNGATMMSDTSWARAKHRRIGQWLIQNASDRQWAKAFLGERRGRLKPFLFPTWRPDLVPYEQPTAGSAFIRVTTDYINGWFPSLGHRRLQVEYADRSVTHHTVHSTAQASGYQEITLYETVANPIPTGGITRVSFLETARLDTDEVRIEYGSAWRGRVELPSVVVQEAPTRTAAWPNTAAKLRSAFGFGTWSSAWLWDEVLGQIVDAIGGVALSPGSTPAYRTAGALADDYAVAFDSTADRFEAPAASTFDLDAATGIAVYICAKSSAPAVQPTYFGKIDGAAQNYWLTRCENASGHAYAFARSSVGPVLASSSVAADHCTGVYRDIMMVIDRVGQRLQLFTDLGTGAADDISGAGTLTNTALFSFGQQAAIGINALLHNLAYAAIATGDINALRLNGSAAIANIRRYTGR